MDRIFVSIDLHALGHAIAGVGGESREAARIAGPHVPFRLAFRDPFGQHFSCTTRLRDTESEHTCLESIGHAWHGSDQWIAIRRVGDRAVDDLRQAGGAENWNPPYRIIEIPFQPVEVVREKLE